MIPEFKSDRFYNGWHPDVLEYAYIVCRDLGNYEGMDCGKVECNSEPEDTIVFQFSGTVENKFIGLLNVSITIYWTPNGHGPSECYYCEDEGDSIWYAEIRSKCRNGALTPLRIGEWKYEKMDTGIRKAIESLATTNSRYTI